MINYSIWCFCSFIFIIPPPFLTILDMPIYEWACLSRNKQTQQKWESVYISISLLKSAWQWSIIYFLSLLLFFIIDWIPPRTTLGHWQQGNFTYSMANTDLCFTWPHGHHKRHNKVGSLSPAKCTLGFLPILNATLQPNELLSPYPLCDIIKQCCNLIGQEHSGPEHHNVNSKQGTPFNEQWVPLKFEWRKST